MRTAYKVWSGIAAGVFCIVAATDMSNASQSASTSSTSAAASTNQASTSSPAPATTDASPVSGPARVTQVVTPANLVLVDGRRVHVTMLNGILPWQGEYTRECERTADLALARKLLLGKPANVTAPPKVDDTDVVVPAGHVQVDLTVNGADYAETFRDRAYTAHDAACPTPTYSPPPTTSSSSGGSGDVDVHVDTHRDHGLPDGALTGGYCRKKWWC